MDALGSGPDEQQTGGTAGSATELANSAVAAVAPTVPASRRIIVVSTVTALVVLLVAEFLYFTLAAPFFFTWDNFLNVLTAAAIIGIIAAPGTMLLIAGQFDLSVGSGVAFCGMVLAVVAQNHGLFLGVVAAIAAGAGLGVLNGFLVTVIEINALITTLGTLAVFRGLTEVLSHGEVVGITGFSTIGTARPFLNIPMPVIILVLIVAIFWFVLRNTTYGRWMYAIGSNPVAARLVGIRSKRIIFIAFLLSGLCVALGGLINASQLGSASPNTALGMELSVITAIVLGGTSLTGGRGTILGTVVGLLVISVLNNGMVLMNIDPFYQDIARGVLLILAVAFDRLSSRFEARSKRAAA
ncbi:MAG: ABC transporter permease [Chloroflexota bacterium]|nr:MAG: ABC transporter permease [Chloroflexota bacterium]